MCNVQRQPKKLFQFPESKVNLNAASSAFFGFLHYFWGANVETCAAEKEKKHLSGLKPCLPKRGLKKKIE